MNHSLWLIALLVFFAGCKNDPAAGNKPILAKAKTNYTLKPGSWRAILKSPGGDLPFGLQIKEGEGTYSATAHNGAEVVRFDSITVDETGKFRMAIDHYDSVFEGQVDQGGQRIIGQWRKLVDHTRTAQLGFEANFGVTHRFEENQNPPKSVEGRWEVIFSPNTEEPQTAVAEFHQNGSSLTGTFLTATGDYRFLAGRMDGRKLSLSSFDGGHAFLFKAELDEQGHLKGDFWSSDKWHEAWIAKPNPSAELPDAMALTHMREGQQQFRFSFPDLSGQIIQQDDPRFKGKVLLVSIFGSWCPNCNDEAPFLQELWQTYRNQGLEVIGLAFEATGNLDRDMRMLQRFQKRHDLDYLILLAGQRDKSSAGAKLPDINQVLAYPTTLFIDRDGKVAHIHTGFSGPGTGQRHEALKAKYHTMIRKLL